jgi:UDP-N-acetylmuramoyl-tripeptide--D-alanyl-D-alanine ligase
MKKILEKILQLMAKLVLRSYQPQIVAVTGSIGKTTTKSAIECVLSTRYKVRSSIKSYNNEFGVPLTILGFESAGKSIGGWAIIILKSLWLILWPTKNYPQVLILEMGADKPGDIAYLTSLAQPTVGVLTAIAPAHLERFKNIENVAKEKRRLLAAVVDRGSAVLNADDQLVVETKTKPSVFRKTYGFSEAADVRASEVNTHFTETSDQAAGTSFKVTIAGSTIPVFLPGIIGRPAVMSALAGMAVGLCLEVNTLEATKTFSKLDPMPGRLRLLAGKNGVTLIDDTYNSSPQAVLAALELLGSLSVVAGRKIAVLGDMLELGEEAVAMHEEIGQAVQAQPIDLLIVVGELARHMARSAREAGFAADKIYSFMTNDQAGEFLDKEIKSGDVILFKGSQGMRLEKIVRSFLSDPNKAGELLVRQDDLWRKN